MYTERIPLLVVLCTFLLLASLALKDWRPLFFLLPLASLFFLSNTLFGLSEINVEVTREVIPTQIMAGGTATIRLNVINRGAEKIDFLEVYDKLPVGILIKKGGNHLILSLDLGEKIIVTYKILCPRRGQYEIGPAYLRTKDPLGFCFNEKTLTASSVLSVLPEIEILRATDLKTRHTDQWPGVIPSRWSGEGTEFYGLRHYIPGDAFRRVEWKASARMGRLITIEHESQRSTDIMIIVDTGRGSSAGVSSKAPLEYGVKAAVSLAFLLLNLGNRVGLIIYGRYGSWLPTNFGKRQFQRILKQLAIAEAGETPLSMGYVVGILGPLLLPPKSQVILISPLMDVRIPEAVRDLALKGYSMLTISPSFLELEPLYPRTSEASKIARQIMALERRNVIAELRRYGIVVDWNPRLPLNVVIKEIMRWHVRTRH